MRSRLALAALVANIVAHLFPFRSTGKIMLIRSRKDF
jgi:hypothetical protein